MNESEAAQRRRGGRDARRELRAAPIPQEKRAVKPGMEGGDYKPLSDAEVERIHRAALDVLEQIGFSDAIPSCIEMFTEAGATLTDEGRKTIKNNPSRISEVNREVEEMGAKVLSQYATLGVCDFLTILDAPDNLTVADISVQLGSRGTVQIQTVPLIEVEEFIDKLK